MSVTNVPIVNYSNLPGSVPDLINLSDKVIKPHKNDSEIVADAVSKSQLKPSNVVQASEQTRVVVQKAAEQLQNFVQSMGRDLSFSVDPTTGYHTVTVVNPSTGEVIRQLPTEELIKLAKSMAQLKNVLVSQKA